MIEKYSQQIEDIINLATEGDLKIALNKSLKLALLTGNESFANWLECEINGYLDTNSTFMNSPATVPDYRKVVGFYLTADGIKLSEYYKEKDIVNFYYIREGVAELKVLAENYKNLINIEGGNKFEFMSKHYRIFITRFVFGSSCIAAILQAIRNQLLKSLIQIKKQIQINDELSTIDKDSTKSFRTHIGQGEISQAIKILETMTVQDDDNELLILEGRFNRLERNRRKGIVNNADYDLEINKITDALIEFKKQLDESR